MYIKYSPTLVVSVLTDVYGLADLCGRFVLVDCYIRLLRLVSQDAPYHRPEKGAGHNPRNTFALHATVQAHRWSVGITAALGWRVRRGVPSPVYKRNETLSRFGYYASVVLLTGVKVKDVLPLSPTNFPSLSHVLNDLVAVVALTFACVYSERRERVAVVVWAQHYTTR